MIPSNTGSGGGIIPTGAVPTSMLMHPSYSIQPEFMPMYPPRGPPMPMPGNMYATNSSMPVPMPPDLWMPPYPGQTYPTLAPGMPPFAPTPMQPAMPMGAPGHWGPPGTGIGASAGSSVGMAHGGGNMGYTVGVPPPIPPRSTDPTVPTRGVSAQSATPDPFAELITEDPEWKTAKRQNPPARRI
jgi:hypothetical protein